MEEFLGTAKVPTDWEEPKGLSPIMPAWIEMTPPPLTVDQPTDFLSPHSGLLRPDGTVKGSGYFGALPRPDGQTSTELSIGIPIKGKETLVPMIVPTLTRDELDHVLGGFEPTETIRQKAGKHAEERMSQGLSPFAQIGEQIDPPLKPAPLGEITSRTVGGLPASPVEMFASPEEVEWKRKSILKDKERLLGTEAILEQLDSESKAQGSEIDTLLSEIKQTQELAKGGEFSSVLQNIFDNQLKRYKELAESHNQKINDIKRIGAEFRKELGPLRVSVDQYNALKKEGEEFLGNVEFSIPTMKEGEEFLGMTDLPVSTTKFPSTPLRPGFAEAATLGLLGGVTDIVKSGGTVLRWGGTRTGVKALQETGKAVEEKVGKFGERFEKPQAIEGSILEEPSLLKDPAWWAYSVANIVPSFAASIIPGLGGMKVIKIGGQVLKWTPQLVAKLATLGGAITGGISGGTLEGANTYQEVIRKGGSEKDAALAGELMTLASATLNTLSVGKALTPGKSAAVKHILKSAGVESITEYLEEPAEAGIKYGMGYATPEEVKEQLKQGVNIIPPTLITGGIGGATGLVSRGAGEKVTPLTGELRKPEVAEIVRKYEKKVKEKKVESVKVEEVVEPIEIKKPVEPVVIQEIPGAEKGVEAISEIVPGPEVVKEAPKKLVEVKKEEGLELPPELTELKKPELKVKVKKSEKEIELEKQIAEQEIKVEKAKPKVEIPESRIANKVSKQLKGPGLFTSSMLFDWADEAFGGTQAEGKYVGKDAYDAMELGINQYILENEKDFRITDQAIKNLKDLLTKVPTETKRTIESQGFQQFSTPPHLAFVANWVADITNKDIYFEPSAGIGGLAIFGKIAGAKEIIVNELSPRRLAILKQLGFDKVFSENAEQLSNLPGMKDVNPTVIVMNPPFSQTAGRLGERKITETGAVHVEQGLKKLVDKGRLVAIMGQGMALDRPAFDWWWKGIREKYNVRAVIGVSGKEYAKYGTTFGNVIAVIDKDGPTIQEPVTGNVEKVEDLIDLLKGVRGARPEIRAVEGKPEVVKPVIKEGTPSPRAEPGPAPPVLPPVGAVELGPGKVPAEGPAVRVDIGEYVRGEPVGRDEGIRREPERGAGELGVTKRESKPGEISGPAPPTIREQVGFKGGIPTVAESVELGAKEVERATKEISEALYESYTPQKISIPNSKPHSYPLVESAAMAFVEAPDPTYRPHLPQKIISEGKLSEAQIESVIYAGQAHSQILPDGQRMGHFIGDGTGVGKGREITAIFLDNWNQGRKKGIWLSQNRPLIRDAKRDMEGIDWDPNLIFDLGKIKLGSSIEVKQGIIFVGYDTLKVKKPAKELGEIEKSRLQQLVDWFGTDYDGVIVFDESHNLGNAVAVRGPMGTQQPSEKALAGLELQRLLPNARIEYVSATGASDVINLAYAQRLGLWGEGTAFANTMDFVNEISAGGIASMELVAQNMKAAGSYMSRGLDMKDVKYEILEHALTENQQEIYNEMAKAWQIVLQNINAAIGVVAQGHGGNISTKAGVVRRNAMSAFWGASQRFFNQIITSMKVPSLITTMDKDLKSGHAVIVQLVNTNEAALGRALSRIEEGDDLEDLDLTPREQLMEYVRNSFPVQQYEEYLDDQGNLQLRPVVDSEGNPVENAEAVEMREALLDKLGSLRVPDGPLEMLFNHYGSQKIAEVTGRTKRVVRIKDEKGERKVVEKWSQAKSMADADSFAMDKKQILVFSYAGGTGRSYHADLTIKNQRLRRHYILQGGWRADRYLQGAPGRSHRTNQKQAPELIPVTTNLKGEKRFTSSIAKRLDQLGALSKGERRTGTQGFLSARENLESEYATNALGRLIEDLHHHRVPDMTLREFEQQTGLRLTDANNNLLAQRPGIPQFLNRILSMTIDYQNKVFDLFSQRLDENIQRAMEDGTLDQGLETLRAKRVHKIKEQVVYTDERTKALAKHIEVEAVHDAKLLDFKKSKQYATQGYVQNVKSKMIYGVSEMRSRTSRHGDIENYHILRGINNIPYRIVADDVENSEKYGKIELEDAEVIWGEQFDKAPKEVKERKHLVTGAVLPIWDRIVGHPRIMRVQTTSGERFIGRLIAPADLDVVLRNLGASAESISMAPREIYHSIYDQNFKVTLANGWQIVRRKVADENRIELKNVDYKFVDELSKHGVFTERISYETRYFVPVGDQGMVAMEYILKSHPAVSVTPPGITEAETASIADILGDQSGFIDLTLFGVAGEKIRDVVSDFQKSRVVNYLNWMLGRNDPNILIKMGPEKHFPGSFAAIQNMESVMSQTKQGRKIYEGGRDFKGNIVRDFRQWKHHSDEILNELDADEKLAVIEILDTQEEIELGTRVEDAASKMRDLLNEFRRWMIENGVNVKHREAYFPHIFHGKFWLKEEGNAARKVETFSEALRIAKEINEKTGQKVSIVQDTFIPPDDATLLSNRSYWRLVKTLQEEIGDHYVIEEALDANDINRLLREEKIAKPKPRARFFGNLLPRLKNNPNFLRDIDQVMNLFLYGGVRKVNQDIFLKKTQRNIESMPFQDDRLKKFIENTYMPAVLSYPSNFEESIAKVVGKLGVYPGATGQDVRRMLHKINLVQYVYDLGLSLSSATANASQFWINAYPIVGERSAITGYEKGIRSFRDPKLLMEIEEMNIASGVSSVTGNPLLHGTTLKDFAREITFREGLTEFQNATLVFFQGVELVNRFSAYWAGKDYALKQLRKGKSAIELARKVAPKTSSLMEFGEEFDARMKDIKTVRNFAWHKKTKVIEMEFAKQFGFELNDKTNFRVGRENLPQILNNMPIRIFSPYKSFLLNQLKFTLDTLGPKGLIANPSQAIRFTGMTLLLAGVAGNPIVYGLFLLINQLSKWLFDKDLKKELVASKWLRGLSGKIGFDISGSVAIQLPTKAIDLLGRFGKLAIDAGVLAYEKTTGRGTIFTERKLGRQVLPSQVQRTVDALTMLREGKYVSPIRQVPIALNEPPWSAAIKRFLGMMPQSVGDEFDTQRLIEEKKAKYKSISSDMTERWATAVKNNDIDAMNDVLTRFSREVNSAAERIAHASQNQDYTALMESVTDFLFWDSWKSKTPKFKEALIRKVVPMQEQRLRKLPTYMKPEVMEMQTRP